MGWRPAPNRMRISALAVQAATGRPLRMAYLGDDGVEVPLSEVAVVRGPGAAS
ncbi:MAG TPA: hypothetical protein VIT65_15885 [Microlunatus sp.]